MKSVGHVTSCRKRGVHSSDVRVRGAHSFVWLIVVSGVTCQLMFPFTVNRVRSRLVAHFAVRMQHSHARR
jgi:hypothetical protein